MFKKLVNYQIGIFGISLKKLTANGSWLNAYTKIFGN